MACLMIKLLMLLPLLLSLGCASSPDISVFVQKNIYVLTNDEVNIDYEANAEVSTDSKLDGTVSPVTDVTTPLGR